MADDRTETKTGKSSRAHKTGMEKLDKACRKYIKHKRSKDIDACLAVLMDDVIVVDTDGDIIQGKAAIRNHLLNNPAHVTYTKPELVKDRVYKVEVSVSIVLGIVIARIAVFIHFNHKDKVKRIELKG